MTSYDRPLPEPYQLGIPTEETKQFWAGCKRHELLIQRCRDCGHYQFYPRVICTRCMSFNVGWVESSGKGIVYSYSVVHRAATEAFKREVPYVVAVIRLDEGVQMLSNVVQCEPGDVRCDMRVEVVFDDITREHTLPKFKPVR